MVGIFQDTVDRLVMLAVFLPVLAGQSGNTGCQALAVTLRGMTLGELEAREGTALVVKEALLGFSTARSSGSSPASACSSWRIARATRTRSPSPLVVWMAMVGELRRQRHLRRADPAHAEAVGADPATASSIFLTTATDVASMGMLLGLATLLVR